MAPTTFVEALDYYTNNNDLIREIIWRNPHDCLCMKSPAGRALMNIFIDYARNMECYFSCAEDVHGFVNYIRRDMMQKNLNLSDLLSSLEIWNDSCVYCEPGDDAFECFATYIVLCWTLFETFNLRGEFET